MSVLNKLRNINSNKAAQLFERHPLANEALELRLQYLAGIALGTAIDREPSETERQAFVGLANSLSVDAAEAEEQLRERDSASEDDIASLFDAVRRKNAAWLFLLDLAWLQVANRKIGSTESEVMEQFVDLLKVDTRESKFILPFALAIKNRDLPETFRQSLLIPENSGLKARVPELMSSIGYNENNITEITRANNSLFVESKDNGMRRAISPSEVFNFEIQSGNINWISTIGKSVSCGDPIATLVIRRWNRKPGEVYYCNVTGYEHVPAPHDGFILKQLIPDVGNISMTQVLGTMYRI